jgi:N-acetylmuramoyl-L-alanine amidase
MIVSAIICLALNVFYEARGASPIDQQAVAAVALNRSEAEHRSVCHVIREPKQFSWTSQYRVAQPRLTNVLERRAWLHSISVARQVMSDKAIRRRFTNVMYYHTHYVRPLWDRHMRIAFATPFHTYYLRS